MMQESEYVEYMESRGCDPYPTRSIISGDEEDKNDVEGETRDQTSLMSLLWGITCSLVALGYNLGLFLGIAVYILVTIYMVVERVYKGFSTRASLKKMDISNRDWSLPVASKNEGQK